MFKFLKHPKAAKTLLWGLILSCAVFKLTPAVAQTTMDLQQHFDAAAPDQDQSLSKYSVQDADAWAAGWVAVAAGANDSQNNVVTSGAIPQAANVLAFLLTKPPATPGEYIADVMQNTGLAPQSYAQGIGFSALSPVLGIWKAFRNLAYFLLIIVFVIVGFMIMLRSQIDHQSVVNFQMALPKIALTLILITFSYAIAGFVVDLIYVVTFVVVYLLSTFGIVSNPTLALNNILGENVITLAFRMAFSEVTQGASDSVGNLFAEAFQAGGVFYSIIDWISSSIAALIIVVAILIAMFRTLFALIMAYVNIILHVIFAPLQLLLNAMPQFNTFGSWLKGLVSNAAVFPAVAIFLLIGIALAGKDPEDLSARFGVNPQIGSGGNTWVAPLLSTGASTIGPLIGLGIILLLPEIIKIVHGVFGFEDKFGFGGIAMGNLQAGWGPVSTPLKGAANLAGLPFRLYAGGVKQAAIEGATEAGQSGAGIGGMIRAGFRTGSRSLDPRMAFTKQAQHYLDPYGFKGLGKSQGAGGGNVDPQANRAAEAQVRAAEHQEKAAAQNAKAAQEFRDAAKDIRKK